MMNSKTTKTKKQHGNDEAQALAVMAGVLGTQLASLQTSKRVRDQTAHAEESLYFAVTMLLATQSLIDPTKMDELIKIVYSADTYTSQEAEDLRLTVIANVILAIEHLCGNFARIASLRVCGVISNAEIYAAQGPDGHIQPYTYAFVFMPDGSYAQFPEIVLRWLTAIENKLPKVPKAEEEESNA